MRQQFIQINLYFPVFLILELYSFSGLLIEILSESAIMYPPKKNNDPPVKTKFTYNGPSKAPQIVGPHKDLEKINKILENAKKYDREKQTKKNYLMEGLNSMNKKIYTDRDGERMNSKMSSKQSQVSSRRSSKLKKNDIYRRFDERNRRSQSSLESNNSDRNQTKESGKKQQGRNLVTINSGESQKKVMISNSNSSKYIFQTRNTNAEQGTSKQTPMPSASQEKYKFKMTDSEVFHVQEREMRGALQAQPFQTGDNQTFVESGKTEHGYGARQLKKTEDISSSNPRYLGQSSVKGNPQGHRFYESTTNSKNIILSQAPNDHERLPKSEEKGIKPSVLHPPILSSASNAEHLYNKSQTSNQQLKNHLERVVKQSGQIRSKYYKAEEEKSLIEGKNRVLERQKSELRKSNEDLKYKNKFLEAEIEKKKEKEKMLERQINDKSQVNDLNLSQLMETISNLNLELKGKTMKIQEIQKQRSDIRDHMRDQSYEIERLKALLNMKEDEILDLHEKNYDNNKIYRTVALENELKRQKSAKEDLKHELREVRGKVLEEAKAQCQLQKQKRQIDRLESIIEEKNQQIIRKNQIVKEICEKQSDKSMSHRIAVLENEMEKVLKAKVQISREYERRLLQKQRQIEYLQKERKDGSQIKNFPEMGESTFENVVKEQIEIVNKLKQENNYKANEVFSLKSEIQTLKAEAQNMANKITVLNAQLSSVRNSGNSQIKSKIQASEIWSLERKIGQLRENLERVKQEVKEKDLFIQNYLVGMSRKEDVPVVLAQLEKLLAT